MNLIFVLWFFAFIFGVYEHRYYICYCSLKYTYWNSMKQRVKSHVHTYGYSNAMNHGVISHAHKKSFNSLLKQTLECTKDGICRQICNFWCILVNKVQKSTTFDEQRNHGLFFILIINLALSLSKNYLMHYRDFCIGGQAWE